MVKITKKSFSSFSKMVRELNLIEGIEKVKEIISNSHSKPLIIGICGGSGAGKSYVAEIILKKAGRILYMDDYYLGVGMEAGKNYNFDEPSALNLKLLRKHLSQLKKGQRIQKPIYDFRTHTTVGHENFEALEDADIIILEGLFALDKTLIDFIDCKVFVHASEKTRFSRRLQRDVAERGRTRESVKKQFIKVVAPMHLKHIEPLKEHADLVIINE